MVAVFVTGCIGETLDSSYVDISDAGRRGAISAGWIPPWLPAIASNIREVHNIDTNESALTFTKPSGSAWRPPAECRPVHGGAFTETRFDRTWVPARAELSGKFDFFLCSTRQDPQMFEALAIERDGTRVLYWRGYAR